MTGFEVQQEVNAISWYVRFAGKSRFLVVPELYNSGVEFRNVTCQRRGDRLPAEPLPCKLRSRSRAAAESPDELAGAQILRLELGERRYRHLRRDAVTLEIAADRLVAVPPSRKRGGPGDRESPVVEIAEPLERLERISPRSRVEARLREPVVDLTT